MNVTTNTEESLTTTAAVSFNSGASGTQFYLGERGASPNGDIKQVGSTNLSGSVTMTPEQAKNGSPFPSLNISGTFFRPTNEGPAFVMPNILSGQFNMLAPLKYNQTLPPIMPIKK
jgi:hypothetical protein